MALQEEFKSHGDFLFRNRSFLPLMILVVGVAMFIYQVYTDQLFFTGSDQFIYNLICLGVCFLGLLIRIITVGYTPRNTSGRNTAAGQVAECVNKKGIYSTVRHPLYIGNFFMWFGVALLTQGVWFNIAFVLAYWVYYERIMYAEESFLRNKFGDEYLEWANRTPAFIPSFKHFEGSNLKFSWRKVLRSEKNGLVAIFVLFYFFIMIQKIIESHTINFAFDFWTIATLISLLIYFVLKFLKYKTTVLKQEGR